LSILQGLGKKEIEIDETLEKKFDDVKVGNLGKIGNGETDKKHIKKRKNKRNRPKRHFKTDKSYRKIEKKREKHKEI
jgi:hypothetical protein